MSQPGDLVLQRLIRRFERVGGAAQEAAALAAPVVRDLIGTSRIPAGEPPAAARRYEVSEAVQERIDAATRVQAEGASIVITSTANPHLRPLVPVGGLPRGWRPKISAPITEVVRRRLGK